jgi:hypothetical protein
MQVAEELPLTEASGFWNPERGVGIRTKGSQGTPADLSLTSDLACLSVGALLGADEAVPLASIAGSKRPKDASAERVHVTVTIEPLRSTNSRK